MVGYWFIWCNLIVAILYTFGYKRILLQYVSINEIFLYFLISYLLLSYNNVILYSSQNGLFQLSIGTFFVVIPLLFTLVKKNIKAILLLVFSSALLALVYCLLYVLYIIRRGFEPTMTEWLILVCCIVLVLIFTIKKEHLLLTVLLTKFCGDLLIYWHQRGQINIKIGDFAWWEFIIFLWISTICFYECIMFLVKSLKLLRVN